jgi:hypothetical protein
LVTPLLLPLGDTALAGIVCVVVERDCLSARTALDFFGCYFVRLVLLTLGASSLLARVHPYAINRLDVVSAILTKFHRNSFLL